jgi:DNA mismatch repair protein MutL
MIMKEGADLSNAASERRIHLLTEDVYNRIAAGEVVERPASVLKELIENSLDAGATQIEVAVSGAGRKEILVSDDGEGMSKDDLLLAFERHATSKVSSVADLEDIRTLGFRGEALSAIASVSRIEATSRFRGQLTGHRLRLNGGKIQDLEEIGAPQGTTLIIRDIFYNTPARKKFLKSAQVESSHLLNVFKRYALAYPDIRWTLNSDGKDLYRLPPETLKDRILAVFSADLNSRLFPLNVTQAGWRLSGFIGAAELARRSRGDQHLFINRRWVQHRLLGHAVVSAYGNLLERGLFPFYILFLELPPQDVDVNVHPAKTEVKLVRENDLYTFLLQSVSGMLQEAGLAAMSDLHLRRGESLDASTGEIIPEGAAAAPIRSAAFGSSPVRFHPTPSSPAPLEAYQLLFQPPQKDEEVDRTPNREDESAKSERTQVYQIHNRYILTEIKGGIAIIDQHAAHERILYEKALKAFQGGSIRGQLLLFPKIIELDAENAERLREVLEDLQKLGINIREFGERSFALEALPAGLPSGTDSGLVLEILDELKERGRLRQPGQESIAAAFACRAAIKFGKSLTLSEMNALIDQLFSSQFPFTCPHGRPTLLKLTLSELERRFGRA